MKLTIISFIVVVILAGELSFTNGDVPAPWIFGLANLVFLFCVGRWIVKEWRQRHGRGEVSSQ